MVLKGFLLYYCKGCVNVQKILANGMCVNVHVTILKLKTKQTNEKKENVGCVLHYRPCLKHLHCSSFFFFFSFLPASLVSCADVVLKCSVSFCPVFDFIPVVSESVLWGLCNKLYFSWLFCFSCLCVYSLICCFSSFSSFFLFLLPMGVWYLICFFITHCLWCHSCPLFLDYYI